MDKQDFTTHTRYTVTLADERGKLRPATLYVYRLHDSFMIARMLDQAGLLRRIDYGNVARVVKKEPVAVEDRFALPEALLQENMWAGRTEMEHYSTSPRAGK